MEDHPGGGLDRVEAEVAGDDEAAGRVVFENVSFRYNDDGNGGGGENVLIGINLVAEPGQTVAILGATGAGKSTLINLVPRFYDASAGRVLVDGVDVRQIDHDSLLAQVSTELQNPRPSVTSTMPW